MNFITSIFKIIWFGFLGLLFFPALEGIIVGFVFAAITALICLIAGIAASGPAQTVGVLAAVIVFLLYFFSTLFKTAQKAKELYNLYLIKKTEKEMNL